MQTPQSQPGAKQADSFQKSDHATQPGTRQDFSSQSKDPWSDFTPPASISIDHPWLSRYSQSALLAPRNIASNSLSTVSTVIYGNPVHPIAFAIGNGGAGYTGLLRTLCTKFIWMHGSDFRIAWVANHSRHALVSLLADVVQVALTYEPEWDARAEEEGWGRVVVGPVFWDHFVLVGPVADPAGLGGKGELTVREALEVIGKGGEGVKFFSRGDGSATFTKEQVFFGEDEAGGCAKGIVQTFAVPPYAALVKTEEGGAYALTDRGTFLTAKRDGAIPNMRVFVEGGEDLLNPCSALVNTKVPDSPTQRLAVRFAEWLAEDTAQTLCRGYGRVWDLGQPLFTGKDRQEFGEEEYLVGREL